ncbi:LapA family protein [Fictibacillus sp. KU28468]|uniref:LapA family protein n=1 Tax=Fictibacillus sp. KU28468 TaxID=2991053 RepID=UPI00223D41B0|nr:LapA family protein [Fictibacillus sp. KU28468]UZJ78035.1 hypothetical protein OKX00_18060 [Fictibacillus sp. KU28468]
MKQTMSMKPWILVGIGTSAAAVWLSSKPNRIRTKLALKNIKRKIKPDYSDRTKVLPVEKGGHPDPSDFEDSKMVSEGSAYGVHYFNEKKQ